MRIGARLAVALGCASLLGGGCTATGMESGIRIGDKTLDQFKEGKTRENWLIAIVGPPTSTSTISDEPGVRILRYSMMEHESPGLVASFFGVSSQRNVSTIYFIIRDNIVERFWADRAETGGLFSRTERSGEKQND